MGTKRSYYDIVTEQSLENERADLYRKIEQKEEEKKRELEVLREYFLKKIDEKKGSVDSAVVVELERQKC